MTLTKSNQNLRRALNGFASDLNWSAVELNNIAVHLSPSGKETDNQASLKMCSIFHAGEYTLKGYTDKEMDGGTIREKPEQR